MDRADGSDVGAQGADSRGQAARAPGGDSPAQDAVARARDAFLGAGQVYGCAESTFVALKGVFGLPAPRESAAAMALNGGIAWSGGPCGAITGASLAIGQLAAARIRDHARAKRIARELVAGLIEAFADRYGSVACRDLIGIDLQAPGAHRSFIEAGEWRRSCMEQIEFVVTRAAPLADPSAWSAAVERAERAAADRDGV
jgi:C_GCAxxG_C_C family probable redox protein